MALNVYAYGLLKPAAAFDYGVFTPANLLGSLIFSPVGMCAFWHGKRTTKIPPLVLGLLLMAFPYFITETWLLYTVGAVLTIGLSVWKEE